MKRVWNRVFSALIRFVRAARLFYEELRLARLLITTLLLVSCLESHITQRYQVSEMWLWQQRKLVQQLAKMFLK